jgi:AraC-like DNA-binding protein
VEQGLSAAVKRAAAGPPLERVRQAVAGLTALPPRLRRMLELALAAEPPLVTVEQAAAATGCDRRTLWRELRQLSGIQLRLQDLIDWVVLVRVSALPERSRRLSAAAATLGIHEQSLARMIRRLTGFTPRQFAARGATAVLEQFERSVLQALARAERRP